MAKERNPGETLQLRSPRGTLRFPKLVEPDLGTEKYPKKNPEYNTGLVLKLTDPGVQKFVDQMDAMLEESRELAEEKFVELPLKQRKALEKAGIKAPIPDQPYEELYDETTEEPTGEIVVKAKTVASGISKKTGKPWKKNLDMFDARGKPIARKVVEKLRIWGGTGAKLNIGLQPYFIEAQGKYGVSRYLNAVQIIELVDGGTRTASEYGFEQEEDGFDANGFTVEDDDATDDTEDFDGGDDDDATDMGNF